MKIQIPAGNWLMPLADAIENAQDGDIIEVDTPEQIELGEHAKERMCPSKKLTFALKVAANQTD